MTRKKSIKSLHKFSANRKRFVEMGKTEKLLLPVPMLAMNVHLSSLPPHIGVSDYLDCLDIRIRRAVSRKGRADTPTLVAA